jgi:hypothetical protein
MSRTFRTAATSGAKVQVRDADTHQVLAHSVVASGGQVTTVTVTFTINGGANTNIELKVLAQNARSTVEVYDLNVQPTAA